MWESGYMRDTRGKIITEKCCACGACVSICPTMSIQLEIGSEGFYFPIVSDNCIGCNRCKVVCPMNSKLEQNNATPKYIVASSYNSQERLNSSSGGVFTALAESVIDRKGVVYGCILNDDYIAQHIRVDKKIGLSKLKKSKYVQSYVGDLLRQVKVDLENGTLVLFVGTPCQIHGLKKYLENVEYDNLITCDFFCHGIPAPGVWTKYVSKQIEIGGNITHIDFRDKGSGWKNYSMCIGFEDGHKYVTPHMKDPFYKMFLNDWIINELCYDCKYKGDKSAADITIGDAWSVCHTGEIADDDTGVSFVVLSSKKGNSEWDLVRCGFEVANTTKELVELNNGYKSKMQIPRMRDKIIDYYSKGVDFDYLCEVANIGTINKPSIDILIYKKNIVIWGCGVAYHNNIDRVKRMFPNILGCCESNSLRWGEEIDGYKIVSPSQLKLLDDVLVVIMLTNRTYINEVEDELIKMGVSDFIELNELIEGTRYEEV